MKAVLVVDVPNDFKFKKSYADITLFDGKHRVWKRIAKVKPMPEKKWYVSNDCVVLGNDYVVKGVSFCYKAGYNDCIDEILGEEE